MDDFNLALRWNASMLHIIRADDDFEFDNSLIYLEYAQKWACLPSDAFSTTPRMHSGMSLPASTGILLKEKM